MNSKKKMIFVCFVFMLITSAIAQPQTDLVVIKLSKSKINIGPNDEIKLDLLAVIKNGFHINSNKPKDKFLIPVEVNLGSKQFQLEEIEYPIPEDLRLPVSPDPVSVYIGTIKIGLKIKADKNLDPGNYTLPIEFSYQGCNDETCFPPETIIEKLSIGINEKSEVIETSKSESLQKAKEEIVPQKNDKDIQHRETLDSVKSTPQNNSAQESNNSLLVALLFAFAGGLILNLMPCVLPVLSLKILGLVQQAREKKREKLKHGLIFGLGVIISFWCLAGLMLVIRAGGEQLGWGFQLQSPAFVIVLSIFLFLFGLSMFGLFEIGTTFTSFGQKVTSTSGYAGSFMSGVLATIVATPCTAPFMGTALGYALSQPSYVALLVFTVLGFGMALPYIVLTSIPSLLKFIPKPGAWMETFKQFVGFMLIFTVLWLIWVLSLQTGREGVITLLFSLLVVSIGGWTYGRWGNISKEVRTRRTAQVIAVIFVAGGIALSLVNIHAVKENNTDVKKQNNIEWLTYTPELVEKYREEGKPVLVDFTAGWCLSCQVNEKVAFGSTDVQKAIKNKGLITVRADWTNKDEKITSALAKFGRNSVPFYVLYVHGKEPQILPEILTPQIVLKSLNNIYSGYKPESTDPD
jgi:thiol:disulfide interchange protein